MTQVFGRSPEVLRYEFESGIPESWVAFSNISGVYCESPAFTVIGDTISFSFESKVAIDFFCSLHLLDGTPVISKHIQANITSYNYPWSVQKYRGQTLYLALRSVSSIDDFNSRISYITIDGTENTVINQFGTAFRSARDKLNQYNSKSFVSAYDEIHRNARNNGRYIPEIDLDNLKTIFEESRTKILAGNPENIAAVNTSLDSVLAAKYRLLLSNPLLSNMQILFTTGGKSGTGSTLKRLTISSGAPVIDTLIDLPDGIIRDPDIDFNGTHAILSICRNNQDNFHIYELALDNLGLTQLTFATEVDDYDPAYLADGDIIFSSTRDMRYDNNTGSAMTSLYRMERNGANIYRIGGMRSEIGASLMPDGRILYTQYAPSSSENASLTSALFTTRPDGTGHSLYWNGGNLLQAWIADAHILPSSGEVLCTINTQGRLYGGTLSLIDRRLGMEFSDSIVTTWPSHIDESNDIFDRFSIAPVFYADPYPIDNNFYLCIKTSASDSKPGVCLVDRFGNELLLCTDPDGCYNPVPVIPRLHPPVIPSRRNFTDENGKLYVLNVYDSTHMQGVAKDAVAFLRVLETVPKHTSNVTPPPVVGMYDNKIQRILGTVPVEEDGSVFFSVPPERHISFQLLDRNSMMIQSMSSSTMVQSGETTGCMGCHDNRTSSPPVAVTKVPLALLHEPSPLTVFEDDDFKYGFFDMVQPILNEACIGCHDYGNAAGSFLNLAPDRTPVFNIAYTELWRNDLTGWENIADETSAISLPYTRGSHASRLVQTILAGHHDISLSENDLNRIITWIDLGAPYYKEYTTAYPENPAGRSPLYNAQLEMLASLIGITTEHLVGKNGDTSPAISFDRPELSPCLSILLDNHENDSYNDALSIILEGKHRLDNQPRADMPGFIPCNADTLDLFRARLSHDTEIVNRAAMSTGITRYDTPSGSIE